MRRWLPTLALDRPVTVLVFFVALLVLGLLAWFRVPMQLMPDGLDPRMMVVRLANPGGTPLENDEQLVGPAHAQLSTIPGIQGIRSTADADGAQLQLEIAPTIPPDEAYNRIVDRMERAMVDMPDEVDRYFLFRFSLDAAPILFMGVTLPEDLEDPYYVLTQVVQPRLERLPGVASVDVRGVPQRSIYIDFDRDAIMAHGVDVGTLQQRLRSDNFQRASGRLLDRGQVRFVRSIATLDDLEALRRYPVRGDLVLEDIASVELRAAISSDIARLNGERAAVILVRKESGANLVSVSEAVRGALDQLRSDPRLGGAEILPFFDQGELVVEGLDNLLWTMFTGGVFAVIVLFLFLREWRMTVLISASIPFSLLITVAVLYFRGDSLNVLTLMGLMLAVGMVVDNAIVVVETIYRRRAEGASIRAAAIEGVAEVNLAILMSTATTMVVFLPLILMTGDATVSVFLGAIGFPVVFALAASLLVALVFAPLATRFMGRAQVKPDARWLAWLTDRYAALLDLALRRRTDTLFVMVGLFLLTLWPVSQVPVAFVDEDDQNQFEIGVTLPPQANPLERSEQVAQVEAMLAANREAWGIEAFFAEVGATAGRGRIQVFLESQPPLPRTEVMDRVRERLPQDQAGTRWTVGFDTQRDDGRVDVTLYGEDMDTLLELGEEAARRIRAMPGVLGARVDVAESGLDELRLILKEDALRRYGLDARTVAGTVSFYLRGNGLEPIRMDGREVDVVSRFELADRDDLETVLDSPVFAPAVGGLVPLRALTAVETGKGPGSVRRYDNRTGAQVVVDLDEDTTPSRGFALASAALADMDFPRGYGWERGQQARQEDQDFTDLLLALGLSVCFVFLLMGILFESWILPLSILTTLPMAALGAWWMLWLTGTGFVLMSGVGLVILVGVVVNNGIVLVDLITQLRAEGIPRHQALVEAGRRRFRPILMTALTTIFGLVPMAVGTSTFVGIPYAPLGRTVIGGLATATLLTLVFVPYLYAALDDLGAWAGRLGRFARLRREEAPHDPLAPPAGGPVPGSVGDGG
jgi:hydrophobic/amphiphilic exporter-1 (mainly G- bacteria), HAE1 family